MAIEQEHLNRLEDKMDARFDKFEDSIATLSGAMSGLSTTVGRHDGILTSLLNQRRKVRTDISGGDDAGENRGVRMVHVYIFAGGAGAILGLMKLLGKL